MFIIVGKNFIKEEGLLFHERMANLQLKNVFMFGSNLCKERDRKRHVSCLEVEEEIQFPLYLIVLLSF